MPITSVSLPEAFLEALLNSPLGIAVLDRELRYTHVNPALAQMNSSDPRAFIGQTVREVVPHLAAILEPALRQVILTGTAKHDLEVFGEGPDAGRVWSEHLLPLRDADGQEVVGVIVTVEEITARKQAQAALLESVTHHRHSVDLNPQIPWTADPDGKILDFSQRWSDLTGLPRESLLGEGWLEVPHPDDAPQMRLAWTHAVQTGDPYDIESRIRRADGSYIWMHSRAYARRDAGGRIVRWYGTTEDIHRRKVTEQALQDSEQRHRHIAEVQQRLVLELEVSNARQAFAVRLGDALRPLEDPLEIQRTAMRVLGEHLQADRVLYSEIEADDRHFVIADNYVRGNVPKMIGRFPLSDYDNAQQSQRRGETFVLPDIRSAGESDEHAAFLAIGVQAIIGVPLHKDGRWVASLSAHQGSPRAWSPEETALVGETAERTWAAVERARAEAELRALAEQFTRTVEDAPIPILLQAEDGEVLRVNRAWTELTGYAHGDLPTMDAWLTHACGQGSEALRDRMRALFAGETAVVESECEIVTRTLDRRTWLWSASSPGHLRDGRRFAAVMATDITQRLAALREVSDGKLLLEAILEHLPVGVVVAGSDGQALMTNPAIAAMWRGVRDLRGRDDYPAYRAWDTQGRLLEPQDWPISRALTSGQAQGSVELRFERFDGTRGTMQCLATPLPAAAGRVARVVAVAVDLSEQREIDDRVRAKEAYLRLALEGNRMVTWEWTVASDEVVTSENFADVYGLNALAGAHEGFALVWPEDHDAHRALVDRVAREGGTYRSDFRITRPVDGRVVWIEERATALLDVNGRVERLIGVATDITGHKATEERLRRNAETFSRLVQGAPFGVYVIDADFRIAQVSVGVLRAFGSVSPLLGCDLAEVLRLVWAEPFASESISRFRWTLATGEPYIAVSTEQREDRAEVESYDWRLERVTLPDGSYGVVCYFHDVTVTQAATQRLEVINEAQRRFVSDAAHELRAPLTSILGNLNLLRRYSNIADEERIEMLGDAEREATRLTRLIADLLMVARGEAREEIELERVALEQSLEAAWRTARSLSERRRFDLGTLKPMVVLGDPDALAQLFLILLENAVKYSPEDGAVRLETIEREGWAEVRVYNDGAGISSDDLERVFERFYRTDRARSRTGGAMGTGLGLTIARQIVERHGGRVWLESGEGRGTTAVVRLPRQASDSAL